MARLRDALSTLDSVLLKRHGPSWEQELKRQEDQELAAKLKAAKQAAEEKEAAEEGARSPVSPMKASTPSGVGGGVTALVPVRPLQASGQEQGRLARPQAAGPTNVSAAAVANGKPVLMQTAGGGKLATDPQLLQGRASVLAFSTGQAQAQASRMVRQASDTWSEADGEIEPAPVQRAPSAVQMIAPVAVQQSAPAHVSVSVTPKARSTYIQPTEEDEDRWDD